MVKLFIWRINHLSPYSLYPQTEGAASYGVAPSVLMVWSHLSRVFKLFKNLKFKIKFSIPVKKKCVDYPRRTTDTPTHIFIIQLTIIKWGYI